MTIRFTDFAKTQFSVLQNLHRSPCSLPQSGQSLNNPGCRGSERSTELTPKSRGIRQEANPSV